MPRFLHLATTRSLRSSGLTALFFAWRYRRRAKRILREGQLAHATVTSVERTNVEVNNLRRYDVTFAFCVDMMSHLPSIGTAEKRNSEQIDTVRLCKRRAPSSRSSRRRVCWSIPSTQEISPRQQNSWVNSGSGNFPSWWYKAVSIVS